MSTTNSSNITVKRQKQSLGLVYGVVSGLSFAILAWGVDALLLSLAHATFSWVKFFPGLIICVVAGGAAGWLTLRQENHLVAFFLWGAMGLIFSWLVVWLPLTAAPTIIATLDPTLAAWFDFPEVADLYQFWLVSLVVCGFAAIINGLLEINLVKQAMFSPYRAVAAMTMLVCVLLLGVAGSATDHMINANFREPIQAIDKLIQFAADNKGQEVPKAEARKMHLSAVRNIDNLLEKTYRLTLIAFDPPLGQMDILVDFEGVLVKCTAIYAQPTDCVLLSESP